MAWRVAVDHLGIEHVGMHESSEAAEIVFAGEMYLKLVWVLQGLVNLSQEISDDFVFVAIFCSFLASAFVFRAHRLVEPGRTA